MEGMVGLLIGLTVGFILGIGVFLVWLSRWRPMGY
jgi:hypothetical protein